MISAWVESEEFQRAKAFFDREFPRYIVTTTSASCIFHVEKFKAIVSNHRLSVKALGLINRVRKEAREFLEKTGDIECSQPARFYLINRVRTVRSGFEYDKNQAYAREAFRLNIISKKSFDSILRLPKTERLIVLGSLATKRIIYEIENGNIISMNDTVEETAPVWKMIVSNVDEDMKRKSLDLDADFYWVDALFTTRRWTTYSSSDWKERSVSWRYDVNEKYILIHDGRKFFIAQTRCPSVNRTRSA